MSTSNDPVVIRAEMARTRAEMSATIEALQEQLDPQRLKEEATTKIRNTTTHLKEEAIERLREATIGKAEEKAGNIMNNVRDAADDTRYSIADTIRRNPIPAALIGVGLAALLFDGSNRPGRGNRATGRYETDGRPVSLPIYGGLQATPVRNGSLGGRADQDMAQNVADQTRAKVQQIGQEAQQLGRQAKDQVGNLTGQVKETVHQLGDQAQDQVGNLTGQVKGTVQQFGNQAQDQVEEFSGNVQDQVEGLTADVSLQAQRLSGSFNRMLRENPLSLGVVAIALGAAAAMIAPQTPQEDQLFGEARDQVLHKAQAAAHGALDQVAEQAQQFASSSAG